MQTLFKKVLLRAQVISWLDLFAASLDIGALKSLRLLRAFRGAMPTRRRQLARTNCLWRTRSAHAAPVPTRQLTAQAHSVHNSTRDATSKQSTSLPFVC